MSSSFIKKTEDKTLTVGVIGLGYVGLPLVLSYAARGYHVIGFDVDLTKIEALQAGQSYIKHIDSAPIAEYVTDGRLKATTDFERIGEVGSVIICGVILGRYAFIAAGAVVTKDVPDYGFVIGVPGKLKGRISRHGQPLGSCEQDGIIVCPESGYRYQEVQPSVMCCMDLPEDEPLPENLRVGQESYDYFKGE